MQTNLFGSSNISTTANGSAKVDTSETTDMFTKLLVAQIQNQDPLSPTDPTQFVNQLAQLSQTESLQSLATLTSASATTLQSLQVLGLGSQVGSELTVSTDKVKLADSKIDGLITLASNSTKTTLTLTGTDGQQHKIELGSLAAGTVPFALDPSVLGLPSGDYTMKVTTSTATETPAIDIVGKLNNVRVSAAGGVVLSVANVGEVAPAAVTGFNGKSATTSTSTI